LLLINPALVTPGASLSFGLCKTQFSIALAGEPLHTVRSVWYRKPQWVTANTLPVKDDVKPYALSALHSQAFALMNAFPDALWISDYYAMLCASDKPLQLRLAAQLGFLVPDTLVTSDQAAAKQFIAAHMSCIIKPLFSFRPAAEDPHTHFFTQYVSADNPPNLTNLHLFPVILQAAIEPVCDVRVTVVGDAVFPARIYTKGADNDPRLRDWRIANFEGKLHIEAYDHFPSNVAKRCVQLVKKLGLRYGAIDFVLDTQNRLWFLEINPNGQWAFIEVHASLPIGKAVATLLSRGAASGRR
jgi:glutathione synthase/RimK-type ligase-like ATP-grasp enzyme